MRLVVGGLRQYVSAIHLWLSGVIFFRLLVPVARIDDIHIGFHIKCAMLQMVLLENNIMLLDIVSSRSLYMMII